jgi:serine protease inhibitor
MIFKKTGNESRSRNDIFRRKGIRIIDYVLVRSLRYSVRNAYSAWPVQLYNIYPDYLINVTNFQNEKKNIEHKTLFNFSL